MTAACAVGQFVIGAWMGILRLQMGKPIEEVGADDPLKIQFNILHKYSVWVLLAGMVFALLAFFVISLKSDTNVTVEKKDG
jgi:phosphotransferase system  glucose/maltose/N-acetylglucosamine-specific IIC component